MVILSLDSGSHSKRRLLLLWSSVTVSPVGFMTMSPSRYTCNIHSFIWKVKLPTVNAFLRWRNLSHQSRNISCCETFELEWSSYCLIWAATQNQTAPTMDKCKGETGNGHYLFWWRLKSRDITTIYIQRSYNMNVFLLWCDWFCHLKKALTVGNLAESIALNQEHVPIVRPLKRNGHPLLDFGSHLKQRANDGELVPQLPHTFHTPSTRLPHPPHTLHTKVGSCSYFETFE
jgi:hypothetical protein